MLGGGRFFYDLCIEPLFDKTMAQLVQAIHHHATGETLQAVALPSSGDGAGQDPMEGLDDEPLRQALSQLKLTDYAKVLLREGVDDFETLLALSNQDLKGMGFKVGHICKIEGLRGETPA